MDWSSKAPERVQERNTVADSGAKERALIAPDMSTLERNTEAGYSGGKQRHRCLE